jgi:nicotinate-nucleotide adenylyltransferase
MSYVGILGGTFDPVHYGHLAMAEGAKHLLGLDQVLFLPNGQPPHKAGRPVMAVEHRANMVKLAIADNPHFGFSSLELDRTEPSYTIDTVRELKALHPDWQFAFIVGMDNLLEIETWKAYEELLSLIKLVVVSRPGYASAQRDRALSALGPALTERIQLLDLPGVDVAAMDLRERAAAGYPLRYLIPDVVADYIKTHHLYS